MFLITVCLSLYPSVCLSVHLSFRLFTYPSVNPPVCLFVCLVAYPFNCLCFSACLFMYRSIHLHVCLSVHPSICLSVYLYPCNCCPSIRLSLFVYLYPCSCVCLSICIPVRPSIGLSTVSLSITLSVRLSACLFVSLTVHLPVCPFVCLFVNLSVCLSACLFISVRPCVVSPLTLLENSMKGLLSVNRTQDCARKFTPWKQASDTLCPRRVKLPPSRTPLSGRGLLNVLNWRPHTAFSTLLQCWYFSPT